MAIAKTTVDWVAAKNNPAVYRMQNEPPGPGPVPTGIVPFAYQGVPDLGGAEADTDVVGNGYVLQGWDSGELEHITYTKAPVILQLPNDHDFTPAQIAAMRAALRQMLTIAGAKAPAEPPPPPAVSLATGRKIRV